MRSYVVLVLPAAWVQSSSQPFAASLVPNLTSHSPWTGGGATRVVQMYEPSTGPRGLAGDARLPKPAELQDKARVVYQCCEYQILDRWNPRDDTWCIKRQGKVWLVLRRHGDPPASATDPPAVRNPRRFTSQFPPKPVAPRHSLPAGISEPVPTSKKASIWLAMPSWPPTIAAWPGPAAPRHLADGLGQHRPFGRVLGPTAPPLSSSSRRPVSLSSGHRRHRHRDRPRTGKRASPSSPCWHRRSTGSAAQLRCRNVSRRSTTYTNGGHDASRT